MRDGGGGYIPPVKKSPPPPPPPPPRNEVDDIVAMKRAAANARAKAAADAAAREAAEKAEKAKKETNAARKEADEGLGDYRTKMNTHARNWVAKNGSKYKTDKALQEAWETSWKKDGANDMKALEPSLGRYQAAVKNELRIAAENAEGGPEAQQTAIDKKAAEIKDREKTDPVLDSILADADKAVSGEAPEQRTAAIETTEALGTYKTAKSELVALEKKKADALEGVNNGFMRQEISDGFREDIRAAEKKVTDTGTAATEALNRETALAIAGNAVDDANRGVASMKNLDPRLRRVEMPEAQRHQNMVEQQYQDVLDGKIKTPLELEFATSDQIMPGLQEVFSNHPDLFTTHQELAGPLQMQALGLEVKPELDTQLALFDPNDKSHPDWLRDLGQKDKVTAAFIQTLWSGDEMAGKALPDPKGNRGEEALAKQDPLTYALFKYAGGTLPNEPAKWDKFETETSVADHARTLAEEGLGTLMLKNPEKFARLQALMAATGDVRADFVQTEVDRLLQGRTPEQVVEDLKDNHADEDTPTPEQKALKLIDTHLQAAFTPDQQVQLWNQAGEPYFSTADFADQADYIKAKHPTDTITTGFWLREMGKYAPAPAAGNLLDATMNKFSGTEIFQREGIQGAFSDALQIVVDRAPGRAEDVAKWALKEGKFNAIENLRAPDEDGTGAALAKAMMWEFRGSEFATEHTIKFHQRFHDEGMQKASEALGKKEAEAQHEYFNKDAKTLVQEMFDDLVSKDENGVYSKRHDFSDLTENEKVNLLGDAMQLDEDNPNAKPGETRYTMRDGDGNLTESGKQIDQLQKWIFETGGQHALVTFGPAIYDSEEGMRSLYLVKVENDADNDGKISGREEDYIVDGSMAADAAAGKNVPWKFDGEISDYRKELHTDDDLKAFQEKNQYDDDGRLYMSDRDDMLLLNRNGHADVNLEGIDAAITTGWEKFRRVGDIALGIAGAVAGAALIVGTGGLAAAAIVAVGAAYGLARSIETGGEMLAAGQSLNPFNTKADGAWLGFIDPQAGGVWLGGAASVTGLTALRPLSLASAFRGVGSTALATRSLRGVGTELFRKNGTFTNAYRSSLAQLPRSVGWSATGSGAALMTGQGISFADAIAAGEVDLTDWSLNSTSWDLALFGSGIGTIAAGRAMLNSHKAAGLRDGNSPAENPPTPLVGRRKIVISDSQLAEMQLPPHVRDQLKRAQETITKMANDIPPEPRSLSAAARPRNPGGLPQGAPRTISALQAEALRLDRLAGGKSVRAINTTDPVRADALRQEAQFLRQRALTLRDEANALVRAQTIAAQGADQAVGKFSPRRLGGGAREVVTKELEGVITDVITEAVPLILKTASDQLVPDGKAGSSRDARWAGRQFAPLVDQFAPAAIRTATDKVFARLSPDQQAALADARPVVENIANQAVRPVITGKETRHLFRIAAEIGAKPTTAQVDWSSRIVTGDATSRGRKITGKTLKNALKVAMKDETTRLNVLMAARSGAHEKTRTSLLPDAERIAVAAPPDEQARLVFDYVSDQLGTPTVKNAGETGAQESVNLFLRKNLLANAKEISTHAVATQPVARRWTRGIAKGVSHEAETVIEGQLTELSGMIARRLDAADISEKNTTEVRAVADQVYRDLAQGKTAEEQAALKEVLEPAITIAHIARRNRTEFGEPVKVAALTHRIVGAATKLSVKVAVTGDEVRTAAQAQVRATLTAPDALAAGRPDVETTAREAALPLLRKAVAEEVKNQVYLPHVGGVRGALFRGSARTAEKPELTRVQEWLPDLRLGVQARARLKTDLATDPISDGLNRDPNSTTDDNYGATGAPTAASMNAAIGTQTNFGILLQGIGHKFGIYESVQGLPGAPYKWPTLKEARHQQLVQSTRQKELNNVTGKELGILPTSNQTAFQMKGTKFLEIAETSLFGGGDPLFKTNLRGVKVGGPAKGHAGKVVVEVDLSFGMNGSLRNPDGSKVTPAAKDFFGAKAGENAVVLPGDLKLGKLMEEFKAGARPAFWSNLFPSQAEVLFRGLLGPLHWVRLGFERRPEAPGFTIPRKATVSKQFYDQAEAMFNQVHVRVQIAVDEAAARDFASQPTRANLDQLINDGKVADPTNPANIRKFVPRMLSGLRKSAVIKNNPEITFNDLGGTAKATWDSDQANLDLIFNDYYPVFGKSVGNPDRTFARSLSSPVKRGLDRIALTPLRNLIASKKPGWLNFRTPQAKYMPTEENILRGMAGKGTSLISTATRYTASASTPTLDLSWIPGSGLQDRLPLAASLEIRGQFKSKASKLPSAVSTKSWAERVIAHDSGLLTRVTYPRWLDVAIRASQNGSHTIVPVGGRATVEAFLNEIKSGATPRQTENTRNGIEDKASIKYFEDKILPEIQDKKLLPPKIYKQIDMFLTNQARPIVKASSNLPGIIQQWYIDQGMVP